MTAVEIDGAVAWLRIDDGAALTLHDAGTGTALRDAIRDCGDRDELKAIVLHAGGDFCPVPDADALAAARRRVLDGGLADWRQIYAGADGLYQTLCFSKKVTIAVVTGDCAGAGALLALCADITLADAGAWLYPPFDHLPEANLALTALTMGLSRAKAWALTGAPLTAVEAEACGLVNRVCDGDTLDQARHLARSVTRSPLDGLAMSKLMVEGVLDTQGVGQEFDMSSLHGPALFAIDPRTGGGDRR